MKQRIFSICARTSLVCLEILAIIAGLLFLTGAVLIWRLTAGPVDVGFAKEYIEQALYDPASEYGVSLQDVVIEWPDLKGPLMLELNKVQIYGQDQPMVTVENVDLGLSMRHLFLGQIKPVSIILTAPSVQLIRTESNEIKFSFESKNKGATPAGDKMSLLEILDTLSGIKKQANADSPVSHLESVEILEARMVMEDYHLGITWYLFPFNLAFARDQKGVVITASAEFPGGRDGASRVQADLAYSPSKQDFFANIHVQDFDPHVLSRKIEALDWLNDHYAILNGNVELAFDADFNIHKMGVALSSVNGELNLEGTYDKPLPYEELFLEASYDQAKNRADIKQLSIKAKGVSVSLSAPINIRSDEFNTGVIIRVPELAQKDISPLWPDSLRGEGAEVWLTQKLSAGRFYDTRVVFSVTGKKENDRWDINIKNIIADFMIEDMTIDYRAPLQPIRRAHGKGHFENDTLTIDIETGRLMNMRIDSGKATIEKVIAGGGDAIIDINLNGPLQNILEYIQPEPIGISEEELGLKVAAVKGQAALKINVSFPAIKDLLAEQVKVKVDGTLSNVLLPDVVKTLDLSGGPMQLTVADGAASIEGQGRLNGQAIKFSWKEYVDPKGKPFVSQVKAALVANELIREQMGIGLKDWIAGDFPVSLTYTEHGGGQSTVDVSANLTPGRLMISPFHYTKRAGARGSASCKIILHNGFVREVQGLQVETEELRLANARFAFDIERGEAVLRRGKILDFILDENDLSIDFEIGRNDLLKLAVNGDFLDARPFLDDDKKKSEKYDGPPLVVSGSIDRMRTHPARMVDQAKFYLNMNRAGDVAQFELDAVAGKGDIYLRLKPNNKGVMTVRLEADDAGAAMKAFDMYENVKGGKIVLYGEAADARNPKIIYGNAELTNFYVVNAPVLARLVSAISLTGIHQLLGSDGIYFSRLESRFEWHISRKGDRYIAKDGRTSGSSLGLTFEGKIDKSIDRIDMAGTIVPVSIINEMIGAIPLIGDILTGGGGGIIAATYKVEGPIKKPEVTVNPLSVLAPGILRKMLFEGE